MLFRSLRGVGLELGTIAWIAVPVSLAWAGLLLGLGRLQGRMAEHGGEQRAAQGGEST